MKHRAPLPSGPFTIETEFDGRISVCDGDVNPLATFDPEYRDLAEEMRDRLTIRRMAQLADQRRCPVCGRVANAVRKQIDGPAMWTHADGTEHLDGLASPERS
jgi:hypothetical protein